MFGCRAYESPLNSSGSSTMLLIVSDSSAGGNIPDILKDCSTVTHKILK